MSDWDTDGLVAADKRYLWHPFTSMHDWCAPGHEPLVLVAKATVRCCATAVDENTSMATHRSGPIFMGIITRTSMPLSGASLTSWRTLPFLASTNPPAIELARSIVELFPRTLSRVFLFR